MKDADCQKRICHMLRTARRLEKHIHPFSIEVVCKDEKGRQTVRLRCESSRDEGTKVRAVGDFGAVHIYPHRELLALLTAAIDAPDETIYHSFNERLWNETGR